MTVAAAAVGALVGVLLEVASRCVPQGVPVRAAWRVTACCGQTLTLPAGVHAAGRRLRRAPCRRCADRPGARPWVLPATTSALFGVLASWTGTSWVLPALLYLAATAMLLGVIDLDVRRLPDAIVLPAYPTTLVLLTLASWNPAGPSQWANGGRALAAAAVLFAIYAVMALAYPAGVGLGDVKLAGILGAYLGWFGWGTLAVGGFAAFATGGLFFAGALLFGRSGWRSRLPFGPWMLVGAGIGIGWGPQLWAAYLTLY